MEFRLTDWQASLDQVADNKADIHGVIEFYSMFYNQPTAKRVVRVCEGTSCHLQGSAAVMDAMENELSLKPGETSLDGTITYEKVPCLGMWRHMQVPFPLQRDHNSQYTF